MKEKRNEAFVRETQSDLKDSAPEPSLNNRMGFESHHSKSQEA